MDDDDWVGWDGWAQKKTNEDVILAIEDYLVPRCEHALEALEEWGRRPKYLSGTDLFSHIHWLVGCYLPKIFEDHFKWRSSTDDGPCVSFIQQVLVEHDITNNKGKSYAPSTISRMIRDVRSWRIRRADE